MPGISVPTTDPGLIGRLGDWTDHLAWREFVRRYDLVIRDHCREFRLDPDALEELCQRTWIDLARCLRTYRYDPGRRFRGWLRRLCQSRAIDFYRQRRAEGRYGLGPIPADFVDPADDEPAEDELRPALLVRAERIQEQVRPRVDDRTWRVFWRIAVEGESVRSVADDIGLSYAAAFAAQKRVRRMLREQAEADPARVGSGATE